MIKYESTCRKVSKTNLFVCLFFPTVNKADDVFLTLSFKLLESRIVYKQNWEKWESESDSLKFQWYPALMNIHVWLPQAELK